MAAIIDINIVDKTVKAFNDLIADLMHATALTAGDWDNIHEIQKFWEGARKQFHEGAL